MKHLERTSSIFIVVALLCVSFNMNIDTNDSSYEQEEALISVVENELQNSIERYNYKSFEAFVFSIGKRESGNNYYAENQFGYVGRYQFGRLALKEVGLSSITKKEFKSNSTLQDKAFAALLALNKHYLRKHIDKYDGKLVNGILITESGMLAAAHLVGASSVKKYLNSNGKIIRKDGNGVALTSYLKKFSGYDTSNIQATKIIDKDTYNLK